MNKPLADKLRPTTLDDLIGQKHLLEKGSVFRNFLENGKITNMIFYGPPGVGKTSVANIIANLTNKTIYKLNGTTAKLDDIKSITNELESLINEDGVLLYLDEIQYFNKKQQQILLDHIVYCS
jgi:putative ATPase